MSGYCAACSEDDRYPHTCGDTDNVSGCQRSADDVVSKPQDIEGVRKPSHYMLFDDVEAIDIIARSMTRDMFKGYILGTVLKYRLRAGKKSELAYMEKDLAKADFFMELYEKHKDKCYA